MKRIGVSKQLRQYIADVSLVEDKSVDATLNRLMDQFPIPNDAAFVSGRTNIAISNDTYDRLNDYKLYDKEHIVSVILRLVIDGGCLNED